MYSGIFDSWHIFQPIKSIFTLIGMFGMLTFFYNNSKIKIEKAFVNAIIIHSIIVITLYFFRDLQNYINSFTGFIPKSYLRVNGLTHSYAATSLIHISALPLIYKYYKNIQKNIYIFLIIFSAFMLARIGLYLGLIFLVYKNSTNINFRKIIWLLIITISINVGFYKVLSLNPKSLSENYQLYLATFKWALESFYSFAETGSFFNKSLETLRITYLNESIIEYLFGTGDFGRNAIRIKTDISYLLYFSYSGLLGLMLLFFIHSRLNFNYPQNILILLIIFFTALKEPTFFTRGLWSVYCFFLFIDYVEKKNCSSSSSST
ncbi:MAG: hypothetical protein ACON42_04205 [Flavobacteriaceae bacterium]